MLVCGGPAAGFCGLCYANRRGRSNFRGHWGYQSPLPPSPMGVEMALKKRDLSLKALGARGTLAPSKWGASFPLLWEFLHSSQYDDETARKPGTLTIFIDEEHVKIALNDRDQGLTAFVSGSSIEEAYRTAEKGLEGDSLEWRPSFGGNKKKK